MRNSIAAYKESLSRIANDVQDAADDLGHDASSPSPVPRRLSLRLSRTRSPIESPAANEVDSPTAHDDEIAQYKADIQKLQASETEIKALSFNYAALLKEKEEQLCKVREENGSLRKSLVEKNNAWQVRDETLKMLPNSSSMAKGNAELSPLRMQKQTTQPNLHSTRSHMSNGVSSKQDGSDNGFGQFRRGNGIQQKIDERAANSVANEKEIASLLEEKSRPLLAEQIKLESEIKELRAQLESERESSAIMRRKLQEEQQLKEDSQKQFSNLKMDKGRASAEVNELQKQLNEKISELKHLQVEMSRKGKDENAGESITGLKTMIRNLEKENTELKVENKELEAKLKSAAENGDASDSLNLSPDMSEGKDDMAMSILQLENSLSEACKERDKALQELGRLKQHLLDQELEESAKMDEDGKIIEELRAKSEYQRAHILQLEKALKQEARMKEEIMKMKSDELHQLNETTSELKQKLAFCMNTVESKNVELLNLQTALGQYSAESEAKERLGRELAMSRDESAKLSQMLKAAKEGLEISKREKEETVSRLLHAERMLSEGRHSIKKFEEENSKLRRALEQSVTTLNRMSLDSDNYVDRRIVIKLLVTYFQRNHSKEVLDLMVRMLGFSEDDKKRIGFAQQVAGKGVVRSVFGLPSRLVGGILGGGSDGASSLVPPENQSFTDLWVDFLLKETEERERRESAEAARVSTSAQEKKTSSWTSTGPEHRTSSSHSFLQEHRASPSSVIIGSSNHVPHAQKQNQLFEHSDSKFATVPLTSSVSPPPERSSKFP